VVDAGHGTGAGFISFPQPAIIPPLLLVELSPLSDTLILTKQHTVTSSCGGFVSYVKIDK